MIINIYGFLSEQCTGIINGLFDSFLLLAALDLDHLFVGYSLSKGSNEQLTIDNFILVSQRNCSLM
jgi:hypothetical protein